MSDDATTPDRDGMTRAEVLALPAVVDITTAARVLGLGRSTAYDLARRGEFPCRILRLGSSYRVPTAELLRVLGIDPADQLALCRSGMNHDDRHLTSTARSRRLPGLRSGPSGSAPPREGTTAS
jgi:excisionase family DNA binding protein